MRGKAKCKILREIRRRIAEENDIGLITRDCTYQGECKGTCPKCEAEVRFLEQELEKRRQLGKAVTVAALAATLSVGLTACKTKPVAEKPATDPTVQTELQSEENTTTAGVPEPLMGRAADTEMPGEPPEPTETPGEPIPETEDLWMGALPRESELEGDVEMLPGRIEFTELEGDVAYVPETTDVP